MPQALRYAIALHLGILRQASPFSYETLRVAYFPVGAGLFHSLKGADLQAFQAKKQVTKKSDWARKW
jgi:hypothetical protein